ncbi:MAG: septum formation initiator family protein [Lachnospiraceae bacterium]|nr:septum formation initiator family protein [Lachnospiraceae bacterium]
MKKKRSVKKTLTKRNNNRQNRVAMLVITFVLCILLGALLIEGQRISAKINSNEQKVTQLEQQIAQENQRTEDISEMETEMSSDAYLEKIAKERLGLVKENEIVFKEAK